jgi:hypothetical protein
MKPSVVAFEEKTIEADGYTRPTGAAELEYSGYMRRVE